MMGRVQDNLSMALANASHSDSPEMTAWKKDVIASGTKIFPVDSAMPMGPNGFQVMSSLMGKGKFDDDFLHDYGNAVLKHERQYPGDPGVAWWLHDRAQLSAHRQSERSCRRLLHGGAPSRAQPRGVPRILQRLHDGWREDARQLAAIWWPRGTARASGRWARTEERSGMTRLETLWSRRRSEFRTLLGRYTAKAFGGQC